MILWRRHMRVDDRLLSPLAKVCRGSMDFKMDNVVRKVLLFLSNGDPVRV